MITAITRLLGRKRPQLEDYDSISTESLERLRSHAEASNLAASVDHYDRILARRRWREGCPYPSCHHNHPEPGTPQEGP